jgi:hypothetical protein
MAATHDYDTELVYARDFSSSMVLVGESGGLSAIYEVEPSDIMFGLIVVTTDEQYPVLF